MMIRSTFAAALFALLALVLAAPLAARPLPPAPPTYVQSPIPPSDGCDGHGHGSWCHERVRSPALRGVVLG